MIKLFQKLNLKKGASMIELLAVVSSASIMNSGVSVKAGDIINEARDIQRIANLRQMVSVMELYYSDYEIYPQVVGDSPQIRFNQLIPQVGSYLGSLPTEKENYDYQDLKGGQSCILKTILENPENPYLEIDFDGEEGGVNCQDPSYCIKIQ